MIKSEPLRRLAADIRANRTALVCVLLYLGATQLLFHAVCPTAVFFGFPCPACGLTRAGLLLVCGRFLEAFSMNPCIYLIVPYFLYLGYFRYFKNPRQKTPLLLPFSVAVGGAVLLVYVVRLIRGTLPPLGTHGLLLLLRELI